jgi:hypothetical protein
LATPSPTRKLACVVSGVEAAGGALVVRFVPVSGSPSSIEDRVPLAAEADLAMRTPSEPYTTLADAERAAQTLRRCVGTSVLVGVAVRRRRDLALWTEAGVEHLGDVIDFGEDDAGLWVRRRGGRSVLRIPRRNLIRYSATSSQFLEVASVEPLPQSRLRRGDRSDLS